MKNFIIVSTVMILLMWGLPIYSQENAVSPRRTPEQEAAKQTDKLFQELNLNQDQVKQVYEINLRYARERQISNKRSEALERMKNKNAEIKQVLSPEQNERLQTKRYERTYLETNTFNRNQPVNTSAVRSSSGFRTNQTVRGPVQTDVNPRKSYRPVDPNFKIRTAPDQPVRRTTTNAPTINQRSGFPNTVHPAAPGTTRRAETVVPRSNTPNTRSQPASVPTQRRIDPPVNPNRK